MRRLLPPVVAGLILLLGAIAVQNRFTVNTPQAVPTNVHSPEPTLVTTAPTSEGSVAHPAPGPQPPAQETDKQQPSGGDQVTSSTTDTPTTTPPATAEPDAPAEDAPRHDPEPAAPPTKPVAPSPAPMMETAPAPQPKQTTKVTPPAANQVISQEKLSHFGTMKQTKSIGDLEKEMDANKYNWR